jgi:hypothetical protein
VLGKGGSDHDGREVLYRVLLLLAGPFALRLYCEVFIVFFRINETLTDVRSLAIWAAERACAEASDEEPPPVDAVPD